jgi:hypothetical protein
MACSLVGRALSAAEKQEQWRQQKENVRETGAAKHADENMETKVTVVIEARAVVACYCF